MENVKSERLKFIIEVVKDAFKMYSEVDKSSLTDKSRFDLVTSTDLNIEKYIISKIKEKFSEDNILSEETNSDTKIEGNTWTLDPIDGTYNMANGLKMYGIQCAMYNGPEIVLSVIYLPHFNELYWAEKGEGAYLNGERIEVKRSNLEHSIVSFGDFPHERPDEAEKELQMIGNLSKKIAKIRMFGAACIDFSSVAAGKTSGTVLFTKNKWDIAPGMLLCKEAGALVMDNKGEYKDGSNVVIVASTEELYKTMIEVF